MKTQEKQIQSQHFIKRFFNDVKNNKSLFWFVVRMVIFCLLYAVIFRYHSKFSMYYFHYQIQNQEPYFAFLIYPMLILFAIVRWEKIKTLGSYKNKIFQTIIFILLACGFFSIPLKDVFLSFPKFPQDFIYYFPMMAGYICLFAAVFGLRFVKTFSNELFRIVYVFALFLIARVLIGKFWIYLSYIILNVLGWVLPLFSKNVSVDSSVLNVVFNNFNVNIGAPCSGVYSLVTFFFLFIVTAIILAQKNKLDMIKTVIALASGLFLVFVLNIIRVTVIILVGGFYSQDLAINLFHEYLSAIFLILLFVVYLYFVFPRIIKKS